jgi:hypothetical protein
MAGQRGEHGAGDRRELAAAKGSRHRQWIAENAVMEMQRGLDRGTRVMISGGGGAELVSEEEARIAIQRGEVIAMDDAGSLQSLGDIRFHSAPIKTAPSWYPVVMAYRQAGMFVNYLRESDAPAFERMMNAILDGRPFAEAWPSATIRTFVAFGNNSHRTAPGEIDLPGSFAFSVHEAVSSLPMN